jgi:DNA processing protein
LIKQGAKLVETAQDILDEIGDLQPAAASDASVNRSAPLAAQGHGDRAHPEPNQSDKSADAGDPVLRALGHDPATLDALLARTGMPTGELSARLLELELRGRVARLPGGLYQRRQVV